ncbi:hypothetical protein SAMN04489712_104131 [Thermomonospora echinospora]|uniref:ATP/GTP-binding protein n=1 Tax=Thermomonospora echinospora TaxID=1992 RepID=A0A1H5YSS2_9ACTN|nr:hypothetical protein SAMN04489712_104131 [Thermomonospora echinospora]
MAHQQVSCIGRGLLNRLIIASASSFACGVVLSQPAAAAPPSQRPKPPSVNGRTYVFGAHQDGRPGGAPGGQGPRAQRALSGSAPKKSLPTLCSWWRGGVAVCKPISVPDDKPEGKPKVSPAELAITEWRRLPVPAPVVRTAPPRGRDGLVGLPHWFWVANWRPLTGRAEAGGVWIEVTARPQNLTIEPGGGQRPVRCSGSGTAYDPSRPAVSQRTDCSYTFTRSSFRRPGGAYRVRATVVWGGTWTGSGGTGGVLPPLSRSVSFPVRVVEAQSLYR